MLGSILLILVYLGLSSHGFGHAARQAAVLQALHALQPRWRLVVSCAVDPGFFRLVFQGLPVEFRRCRWDVGMVQVDALSCDQPATLAALDHLNRSLPAQLDQEVRWIEAQGCDVVVLGDIPPAIATLAQRLQSPLIWMGNFGWDDIYRDQGEAFAVHRDAAASAYAQGSLLLRMPFDLAMDWGLPEQTIGLTSACPRPLPDGFQTTLRGSDAETVLLGFGGLGLRVAPSLFNRWPNHRFLVAPLADSKLNQELSALANVTLLPSAVRPLDVMPFCSRLIGKPGFSTFSEAMTAGVGLHVVERTGFSEAAALVRGLRQHGRHRCLDRASFDQGEWELDQPLLSPTDRPLPQNGAAAAAAAIDALVMSQTRPKNN